MASMTSITAKQLDTGLTIYCDGGCRNQQFPELREGYGSFKATRDGSFVETTWAGEKAIQHFFKFGKENNIFAELHTARHALLYAKGLADRGWQNGFRICLDSATALAAITTDIKKPAPQYREIYGELRQLGKDLDWCTQFVKIQEQDMKKILGH